ncbi:tyrosine-type recombinase/integrase [Haloferax sp. MBLA0076]|uniref:Tyrosine-type recombinase/integrase n=1 Tax=Haloferax litoreum TaxID=2666140 RepID=A0A6A8GEG8_9EURY|nr:MULTISPECIES: tyrosine-type recombinase/integrase [Haloferax]KAB1192425.1 tyrosine-type recombinase/integrase [Haloferax sp. CBA1148]MRX20892.1 tyrosine-type recombinase/integrase [Haloferax litoreum]
MTERQSEPVELRVPDELAQEYLRKNSTLSLSPQTVKTYDSHLTQYATFLHAQDKSILTAEFIDLIEFIEECVLRGNRETTISGKVSTVSELYRYIRLRTDVGDELLFDPLRISEIDLSRYNTPELIKRDALTREEIRKLFSAFNSYRNRLIVVVGIETGLRNSDLREIKIDDVNTERCELHVPTPKYSKPYDVPISDELEFEIGFWLRHHRPAYCAANESEYLFPSQSGHKLEHNSSLNKIVRDAADRAGVQRVIAQSKLTPSQQDVLGTEKQYREWHRVTPHTLRHSFITLLNEAGVSLEYRQLLANHSTYRTTQGYTHSRDNIFESIRDQFDPPR